MKQAENSLRRGGIIAYPTEAVWGLGCDPFNEAAVMRLLALKQRSVDKGLILIAASWEQISDLVTPIPPDRLQAVLSTWPGPVTWIFPASNKVPAWIRGTHATVALRVMAHPIANQLCEVFGGPIVSTSANIEGAEPARDIETLQQQFPEGIDAIISGELGDLESPTEIRDATSGRVIRE